MTSSRRSRASSLVPALKIWRIAVDHRLLVARTVTEHVSEEVHGAAAASDSRAPWRSRS
jgi:hypothetical protein